MSVHRVHLHITAARRTTTHYARGARNENGAAVSVRYASYRTLNRKCVRARAGLSRSLAAVDRERFVSKIAAKLTVRDWFADREVARRDRESSPKNVVSNVVGIFSVQSEEK